MKVSFNLKSIRPGLFFANLNKRFNRHMVFAALLIVLLCYIFVVFQIKSLASTEPDSSQQAMITNSIPKIDKKAVEQIQSLEQRNTQIRALFEQARNNPFSE